MGIVEKFKKVWEEFRDGEEKELSFKYKLEDKVPAKILRYKYKDLNDEEHEFFELDLYHYNRMSMPFDDIEFREGSDVVTFATDRHRTVCRLDGFYLSDFGEKWMDEEEEE